MTTVFERLGACTPVDRKAADIFRPGEAYVPDRKPGGPAHWTAPPALRPVPQPMPDLRGRSYGRITVVGLLADTAAGKPRWLVRCACGDYEARTSKAVARADACDACTSCRHQTHLRHKANFMQYGQKVADEMRDAEFARARGVAPPLRPKVATQPPARPGTMAAPRRVLRAVPNGARGSLAALAPLPAAVVPPMHPTASCGADRLARSARESLKAAIRTLTSGGSTGADLARAMTARYPNANALVSEVVREMVAGAELVEVAFTLPPTGLGGPCGGILYLPAGASVSVTPAGQGLGHEDGWTRHAEA